MENLTKKFRNGLDDIKNIDTEVYLNKFKSVADITRQKIKGMHDQIRNKSQYQKVIDFHKCAGHPYHDVMQKDYILTNPKRVDFRVGLIKEELSELEDAIF